MKMNERTGHRKKAAAKLNKATKGEKKRLKYKTRNGKKPRKHEKMKKIEKGKRKINKMKQTRGKRIIRMTTTSTTTTIDTKLTIGKQTCIQTKQ